MSILDAPPRHSGFQLNVTDPSLIVDPPSGEMYKSLARQVEEPPRRKWALLDIAWGGVSATHQEISNTFDMFGMCICHVLK